MLLIGAEIDVGVQVRVPVVGVVIVRRGQPVIAVGCANQIDEPLLQILIVLVVGFLRKIPNDVGICLISRGNVAEVAGFIGASRRRPVDLLVVHLQHHVGDNALILKRLHHVVVDLKEIRIEARMVGLRVGAAENEQRRRAVVPLVGVALGPTCVVGIDVDQHMIEAAGVDLVDQMVHHLALRGQHVGAPQPVGLVTHQEVARAVLVDEVRAVQGIDHERAVDRLVGVGGSCDRVVGLVVQRGHGRDGSHLPLAGHGGSEADLPCVASAVSAVVKAGNFDADPVGSGEFAQQINIERIAARLRFKAEIVHVVLLHGDGGGQHSRANCQKKRHFQQCHDSSPLPWARLSETGCDVAADS